MCCASHGKSYQIWSVQRQPYDERLRITIDQERARRAEYTSGADTGDTPADDGAPNRCQCLGFTVDDMCADERSQGPDCCRCSFVITGEDLRCNRCRRFCLAEWTPRIMSPALTGGTP